MREDTEIDLYSAESAELKNSLFRWRVGCIISCMLLAATIVLGLHEYGENKLTRRVRREEIIASASRLSVDSPEKMEALFDSARFLAVDEAIPFAVLVAVKPSQQSGQTQYHVIAARRYLKDYSIDEITAHVRASAVSDAFRDADALLAKLPELLR